MALLTPSYIFEDVTHITPQFLQSHGIRGLALDVDNTLTAHGSQELSQEVADWLELMKQHGIHMSIVSNNFEKRVAPFADKLGLEHQSFCCKPYPGSLAKVRRSWGMERSEIALVGDQLFTDSLAAGLYGIKMLLVMPLAYDTKMGIRLKRKLESPFINRYYRKGGKLL